MSWPYGSGPGRNLPSSCSRASFVQFRAPDPRAQAEQVGKRRTPWPSAASLVGSRSGIALKGVCTRPSQGSPVLRANGSWSPARGVRGTGFQFACEGVGPPGPCLMGGSQGIGSSESMAAICVVPRTNTVMRTDLTPSHRGTELSVPASKRLPELFAVQASWLARSRPSTINSRGS